MVYRRDIASGPVSGAPLSEVKVAENIGFEVIFRRLATRPDGAREMEVEYRRKWRQTWRDGTAMGAPDYSAAVGKKLTLRLLPDGTVEALTGCAAFPAVVNPANGQPIPNTDFMWDVLYLLPRFPGTPISIGSTWEAPAFVLPDNPESPPIYRYTLLNRVMRNGEDCLRIAATYATRTGEQKSPDGTAVRLETAEEGIGVYYFSLARGMIVAKSLSWQDTQTIRRGERLFKAKTLSMYEALARFD